MRNPFQAWQKAARLVRRRRPFAAAKALGDLLLPAPARPAPKAKPRKKPAAVPTRTSPAKPGTRPQLAGFCDGSHKGLAFKLYTPARRTLGRVPLVVMLHGCRQSSGDFAVGTQMNRLADALGFVVLYPAQSAEANLLRCWNWHRTGDQRRGGGEVAALAALTRAIVKSARIDPARVYVAGLSAGGSAAANLAAAYPDIFAAVGVHSAVAPGHVHSIGGAIRAMQHGLAPAVSGPLPSAPPTIVFQGDQDRIVHPSNLDGFAANLRRAGAAPAVAIRHEEPGATRSDWRVGAAPVVLEQWLIHGGGHAWSGGNPAGSFADPAGPDASREMLRFFLARKRGSRFEKPFAAKPAATARRG